MTHRHAVVWLDHQKAHVIKFGPSDFEGTIIHSKLGHTHLHHKANSIGDGRASKDPSFFDDVANSLKGTGALLVTGPGLAKIEFVELIRSKHRELAKAIEGIEPLDHPTEAELLKFARSYMGVADRLQRRYPW